MIKPIMICCFSQSVNEQKQNCLQIFYIFKYDDYALHEQYTCHMMSWNVSTLVCISLTVHLYLDLNKKGTEYNMIAH